MFFPTEALKSQTNTNNRNEQKEEEEEVRTRRRKKDEMDALWRPSKVPLTGWLGALFVPGLLCYLHSVNLNEYPKLENSRVERLDLSLIHI